MNVKLGAMAVVPVCVAAAIQDLTTDHTGSVLMFSANAVLRAQPTSDNSKIFRWTKTGGITIYLERAYEQLPLVPGRPGDYQTPYFNITSPHLSGDGRDVAVLEQRVLNRMFGAVSDWRVTWRTGGGAVAEFPGGTKPSLSANGRYIAIGNSVYDRSGRLINVASWAADASGLYPKEFEQTRQRIADNGTLVGLDTSHNVRVTPILPTVMGSLERAMVPSIDPAATVIVYETFFQQGVPRRLIAIDIASGVERIVASDPGPEGPVTAGPGTPLLAPPNQAPFIAVPAPAFGHSISADGAQILAILRDCGSPVRQWLSLVRLDGSGGRRFGFAAEGYREAVLSGDGRVVFGATALGRLLRIDLESGETEEILPRTPWVDRWTGVLSEGSIVTLVGGGFPETALLPDQYPAATRLGGVSVELDGRSMPITMVTRDRIQFQVPWESGGRIVKTDPHTLAVRESSDSLLATPTLGTDFRVPLPLDRGRIGRGIAFDEVGFFREDGIPVTLSKPAQSGGTMTLHITGIDQPRTATGLPFEDGPFETPEWLRCAFGNSGIRLPLQGYRPAPGRVGWHEVRLSIPDATLGLVRGVSCSAGDGQTAGAYVPFEASRQ